MKSIAEQRKIIDAAMEILPPIPRCETAAVFAAHMDLLDWAKRARVDLAMAAERLGDLAPMPNAELLESVDKLLAELPE